MRVELSSGDVGAGVLCGGASARMHRPKAWLPFGDELLLQRVVRRVGQAAAPVAVVAAPEQALPPLDSAVRVVRDPVAGRGPLMGIAVGLAALAGEAAYAFVSSTDAPFVGPELVRAMRQLAEGHDAAVVIRDGRYQPLAAVYATHLGALARELVESGERRPWSLLARCRTRWVEPAELLADESLRAADPELRCLDNVNTPQQYASALRDAGLTPA